MARLELKNQNNNEILGSMIRKVMVEVYLGMPTQSNKNTLPTINKSLRSQPMINSILEQTGFTA